MLPFDSYLDVLGDHARSHHVVKIAWLIVVATAFVVLLLTA